MDKKQEMERLITLLNQAGQAYYNENKEIMSNFEYDGLYDKLVGLEDETGIIMANSPTQKVGYEVATNLPKEEHLKPMLSLDKTKEVEALKAFVGDKPAVLSWKLDGITIVLTYEEGRLTKAVTRGSGKVGEVVTANSRTFANLPLTIPYKETLVIRGEAIITYSQFEEINRQIPELDAKYKNPRNLCSGSVRQLNPQITAERGVRFVGFSLVEGPGETVSGQLKWLEGQGFEVVDFHHVNGINVEEVVEEFREGIKGNDYPSDGLVLTYDDLEYGRSLGTTAKFPRDALAFKWEDEEKTTNLREIEWSPSRTGLINPIAIFDPVELEGTTVTRASVHNVSILKELKLGIGDEIMVYKANMIIPQISQNLTGSGPVSIPDQCPVCQGGTKLNSEGDVETLTCTNPHCPAKEIKSFALLTSRDGLNIEGLSEQTIEKLTALGIVKEWADFFRLEDHKDQIINMEGFGLKSYENLRAAALKASRTTGARLIYSLGIPGIGTANGSVISNYCGGNIDKIRNLTKDELMEIEGIGQVMAAAFVDYFQQRENQVALDNLLKYLTIEEKTTTEDQILDGLTFVITGSVEKFQNRKELKEFIEDRGGKVATSVSKNTDYLINNDNMSSSSKNKKATELGVEVISEDMFMANLIEGRN